MEKEFIPYKQAVELKELGFDEPYYFATYLDSSNLIPREEEDGWDLSKGIIAPLYQQAFRWFRDKKLSDGSICRHGDADGGYSYRWDILHEYGVYEERHFKLGYKTYEEAELACLIELVKIIKQNGKETDRS